MDYVIVERIDLGMPEVGVCHHFTVAAKVEGGLGLRRRMKHVQCKKVIEDMEHSKRVKEE